MSERKSADERLIAELRDIHDFGTIRRDYRKLIGEAIDRLESALTAHELCKGAADRYKTFYDAVTDACVTAFIFQKIHETDARKAVNDLLVYEREVALDPSVSKRAAELRDTYKAERDDAVRRMEQGWIQVTQTPIKEVIERAEAAETERDRLRALLVEARGHLLQRPMSMLARSPAQLIEAINAKLGETL